MEIKREKKEDVLFHNLYKASSEMPEALGEVFQDVNHRSDEIYSQSAYTMEELDLQEEQKNWTPATGSLSLWRERI